MIVSSVCGSVVNERIDLTGQQINEWKVLKYLGNRKYLCKCSCGKEKEVSGYVW